MQVSALTTAATKPGLPAPGFGKPLPDPVDMQMNALTFLNESYLSVCAAYDDISTVGSISGGADRIAEATQQAIDAIALIQLANLGNGAVGAARVAVSQLGTMSSAITADDTEKFFDAGVQFQDAIFRAIEVTAAATPR